MKGPGFVQGWQRFWFAPQPTSTLALFRIAFGGVVTLWFATLGPMLLAFFGASSAMVEQPVRGVGTWTLFTVVGHSTPVVVTFWLVSLLGCLALTLGYETRLASVVVFVGLVSFERHIPLAVNAGDMLLRFLSFYLIFAPAGAALSVDRWRADRDRFWTIPRRAPWALRLLQIQLSVIYISTVWEKVQGVTWRTGTAVSYALRPGDIERLPAPAFVTDSLLLTQVATFGTLALELSIGILVWNRVARPWVLGLGVLLHLSIDLSIAVGFFSAAMLTLYLVFIPPETATRLVVATRARVENWRGRASEPPSGTPDVPSQRTDASRSATDTNASIDDEPAGSGSTPDEHREPDVDKPAPNEPEASAMATVGDPEPTRAEHHLRRAAVTNVASSGTARRVHGPY